MKNCCTKAIVGIIVALLLLSVCAGMSIGKQSYAQAKSEATDFRRTISPVPLSNGATITFVSHTYDSVDDISTWTYEVISGTAPSLSHWILELGVCIDESDIVDASETYEFCEDDPHNHIRGIKFDTGYADGETRVVWFKLQGDYPEGTVAYGYKEGTHVDSGTITGPICNDDPGIDIEKKVWDETSESWEDDITAPKGSTLQFKLIVENTGNLELTSLTVEDNLPDYLTYVSGSASPSPDASSDHQVTWTFDKLEVGNSKTFTFSADATNTGDASNSANVVGHYSTGKNSVAQKIIQFLSQLFDSLNLNFQPIYRILSSGTIGDCDAIPIKIVESQNPNIDIIKKVKDDGSWVDSVTVNVGDDVEFKLAVMNTGDVSLSDVVVTDTLPDFLSSSGDLEWNLGTIPSGSSEEITFTAHADAVGDDDNIASAEGTYASDTVSDSDLAHVIVEETPEPGIEIIKKVQQNGDWVDSATVTVGDTVHFKLLISNTGNVDLTEVVVSDDIPAYLTYNYDATDNPDVEQDNYVEWQLGLLTVGSSEEILFSAIASAEGDGDNYAAVSGTDECTTVEDDDTAHVVVEVCATPAVEIVKQVWDGSNWVDSVTVNIGENVDFKIIVTNTGNVDLDSYVHVDDDLPDFLSYNDDANPSPTSSTSNHVEWHNLAPLAEGNSITITFSAHADCAGEGNNAAVVEAQHDCTTPVTDSDTAHVIVEECANPAVEIIKKVKDGSNWVDSTTVNVGDDVEFKLTVTNMGNVPLDTYVHVSDNLPGFLTYNYDGSNTPDVEEDHHVEWNNLAPLAAGDSVVLTFSVSADAVGEGDNSAAVEAKYDCKPPVSDSDNAHVKVVGDGDEDPPETTKEYGSPFYTDGTNDWITFITPIYINATDDDSGVAYAVVVIRRDTDGDGTFETEEEIITVYDNDGSDENPAQGVISFTIEIQTECHHKIEFYSVDNACNEEQLQWQTVYVDNTPPCSSYTITNDPDHYVCHVSQLTITATDGGKCPVGSYWLYCYVDGDLYKKTHNKKISFQFNELYGFTEDKRYEVEFWAEDELGNEENHQIEGFILDTTPPDTDYSFDGPNRWVDYHWQIEPTTKIVFTATDSSSGVKYTKYRQGYQDEGGTWETYSGPFIPAKENIFYYSKDNCGNQENLVHLYVEIVDSVENKPPQTPSKPIGQTYGHTGMTYTYTASTTDPENDKIKYYFSWGDGTGDWTTLTADEGSASHIWTQAKAGTYKVKVKARDANGAESNWSPPLEVYISNQNNEAPATPSKPSGPTSGGVNIEYTYSAVTSDPEGDNVMYVFDWGDSTDSGWLGPYKSGETITATHTWTQKGNYEVRVKARDVFGDESEWSKPLPLSMPKQKQSVSSASAHMQPQSIKKQTITSINDISWFLDLFRVKSIR